MGIEEIINENSFHNYALLAFVEQWQEQGSFPPDCELTRKRAYKAYEDRKKSG